MAVRHERSADMSSPKSYCQKCGRYALLDRYDRYCLDCEPLWPIVVSLGCLVVFIAAVAFFNWPV